jgi:hypothetical protein
MLLWLFRERAPELVKSGVFALSWSKPNRPSINCYGVRLTPTKVVFRTPLPPSQKEFDIEFQINERLLHARVSSERPRLVATPAGYQHELVCRFLGIAADDWDCLMRYLRGETEAAVPAPYFDSDEPDDEFRGLPMMTQQQIIADLVEKGHLNRPVPGVAPLIRMRHEGTEEIRQGMAIVRFAIRSRFIHPDNGTKFDFESKYAISEGHATHIALPGKGLFASSQWKELKHHVERHAG